MAGREAGQGVRSRQDRRRAAAFPPRPNKPRLPSTSPPSPPGAHPSVATGVHLVMRSFSPCQHTCAFRTPIAAYRIPDTMKPFTRATAFWAHWRAMGTSSLPV